MINNKKILVVLGGRSKERDISIQTGKACFNILKENKFNVIKYDPQDNIIKKIKKFKPDIIFNCLHGKFGEDGQIQKIFEKLKIPYTHSGPNASRIAMDKVLSKKIFIKNSILTPKYKIIKKIKDLQNIISKKKFVIKPINEGSSVGVKIYDNLNYKNLVQINTLLKKFKILIQEEFIIGKEVQAAVLNNKSLGAIEIKPKREFYDYKAKYSSKAKTQHIMPAKLKKKYTKKLTFCHLKLIKLLDVEELQDLIFE